MIICWQERKIENIRNQAFETGSLNLAPQLHDMLQNNSLTNCRSNMVMPDVKKGQCIKIGKPNSSNKTNGYIFDIFSDGTLGVGYLQPIGKAIKEDVIWNGEHWEFRASGPDGSYLRGPDEFIVKQGPPRR